MIEKLRYDEFAENSILGVCLLEGGQTFAQAKQYIKKEDIFYIEDNKLIWGAMSRLYEAGTPIDEVAVCRELRKTHQRSFGGDSWPVVTMTKTREVVSGAHLMHWCISIVDDYIERISTQTAQSNKKGKSSYEILKELDLSIKEALSFKNIEDWADMSQMGLELIDRRERIRNGEVFGVMTGIHQLDKITGGLETGLIVIAARPSMGKTAFASSLAVRMASLGSPIGLISLEMPKIQLSGRIISILSGTEFWRVFGNKHRNQSEENQTNKIITEHATLPIYVSDQSKVNLSDIRYKTEKLIKTKGAKCIIIDYIQLVDVNDTEFQAKNREQQVSALSKGLTRMSKDFNIPIIALAQLNRESENAKGTSSPGKLSQLRESDAILADATMGIIVDRPFKRGELVDLNNQSTENKASIIIEKFRNGATTTIPLDFDPETMMFMNEGELDAILTRRQHTDFSTAPNLSAPNF